MNEYVLFLLALSRFKYGYSQDLFLDPNVFSEKVITIVENSLKRKEIQEHFDTLSHTEESLGENEINQIVEKMDNKFQSYAKALHNLQRSIEEAFLSGNQTTARGCCESTNLKYNSKYLEKVDENNTCLHISRYTPAGAFIPPTEGFVEACKENTKNNPLLRWQVFGSEDSYSMLYPAVKIACNSVLDPKLRPWFYQADVDLRMELAIVIDENAFFTKVAEDLGAPIITIAKEAIKATISQLRSHDQVAVIIFGEKSKALSGKGVHEDCLAHSFAMATAKNKKKLKEFIDDFNVKETTGKRYYEQGLKKAFSFFEKTYANNSKDGVNRIILFLSDGEPNDSRDIILNLLESENTKFNNSITLLTYGIGSANFSILQEIAMYNLLPSKKGSFQAVTNPRTTSDVLPYFYKLFNAPNITEPIYSDPYFDRLGLGYMMSATLPVFHNGTRVGVVSLDIVLSDLFAEPNSFRQKDLTYVFVLDGSGRIFSHPFLPISREEEAIGFEVTVLEQDKEFLPILKSMKRGENGNTTFVSTKFVSKGTHPNKDAKRVQSSSKYFWKKIPSANFSVCLIIGINDFRVRLTTQESVPINTYLHDRLDLVPPKSKCMHAIFTRPLGTINQTSVFLAASAFENPEEYLYHNFTKKDIIDIGRYMEGTGPNTFNIKDEAKQEVVITYKAEDLWKAEDEDEYFRKHVVWRYIGTKSGVFRIFPAVYTPKFYDPTLRSWYVDAQSHKDQYIVTLPYFDFGSDQNTRFITLCKALFEPGANSSRQREVIAVVGTDILLEYLEGIFRDLYSDWITSNDYNLYLTDSAGFLVLAEKYETVDKILHLNELEPEIANVLILSNILRRVNCSQLDLGLLQRQYQMKLESNVSTYRGVIRRESEKCYSFSLFSVPKTNTFILLRSKFEIGCGTVTTRHVDACKCFKDSKTKTCETAWNSSHNCECPCEEDNPYYNSCSNIYQVENNSYNIIPCVTRSSFPEYTDNKELNLQTGLPTCYELNLDFEKDFTYSTIVFSSSISSFVVLVLVVSATLHCCNKKTALEKGKIESLATKRNSVVPSAHEIYVEDLERVQAE